MECSCWYDQSVLSPEDSLRRKQRILVGWNLCVMTTSSEGPMCLFLEQAYWTAKGPKVLYGLHTLSPGQC